MDKRGPIILVDDDEEDLSLLIEIFADMNLRNEIHLFKNTSSVISFLQRPDIHPFLIISDINMPIMNGFQLRSLLSKDPIVSSKKIPYLFVSTLAGLSTMSHENIVADQGIFRKPSKRAEWKEILETIVKYWTYSMPPDTYE